MGNGESMKGAPSKREAVANRLSDLFVNAMNAELAGGATPDAIFAGALLALLALGANMPEEKPMPLLMVLSAAEVCILEMGATFGPSRTPYAEDAVAGEEGVS